MNAKRVRYMVLKLNKKFEKEELEEYLEKLITRYFGIFGLAEALPRVIVIKENSAVIRTSEKGVLLIRASLIFSMDEISIMKVTGTLRKAKRIWESLPKRQIFRT